MAAPQRPAACRTHPGIAGRDSIGLTFNPHFTPDESEYLAEREAIAEYDGGLDREAAKDLAYRCYIRRFRPDMISWYFPEADIE